MERQVFAGLLALLLVGSILPSAFARDGVRVETELESEVEIEDSTSNASINGSIRIDDRRGRGTDDGPEDDRVLRAENRIKEEFRNGSIRVREERRERFDELRTNFTARNGTNLSAREMVELRKETLERVKDRREQLRQNYQAQMEVFKEDLKRHEDRIKELRENYTQTRDDFKEARDKEKAECRNAGSEKCKAARQELNGDAKEFMGNAAEQMQRIILTMRTRVEANTNIDDETAADVVAKLNAHGAAIEAAQAKVNNLSNSTDVNATKQAAAELRAAWTDARVTIRLTEGLLVHARFQEFLNDLTGMEGRFKEARETLATNGSDVTKLDADIASFSAKIDAAQTSYAAVQQSYLDAMGNATTEAQANALLKSTRDQIKVTQDGLKEARDDLRSIIKEINALDRDLLKQIAAKVAADTNVTAEVSA